MDGAKAMAEPYKTYLSVVSVVDLDLTQLLPLNCMSADSFDHFDVLLATTLVPLGAALVLVFVVLVLKRGSQAAIEMCVLQATQRSKCDLRSPQS